MRQSYHLLLLAKAAWAGQMRNFSKAVGAQAAWLSAEIHQCGNDKAGGAELCGQRADRSKIILTIIGLCLTIQMKILQRKS